MKKILAWIKTNYTICAYVGLTLLLLGACFYPVFAWLATGYIIVWAVCARRENQLVALILFVNSFYAVLHFEKLWCVTLDMVSLGVLTIALGVHYVVRLIRKEQKPNWKTLIPLVLFVIYAALPLHYCTWFDAFATLFFLALLYLVFETRKHLDFCFVVRAFVIGLIIACSLALLKNISPLLKENMVTWDWFNLDRFSGLCYHPNILNSLIMIAICALLLLKYKNKIPVWEFTCAFFPLFFFGYLTISRSFVMYVLVGIAVFAMFNLLKNKIKTLSLLCVIFIAMGAVMGILWPITQAYLSRISNESHESFVSQLFADGLDVNISGLESFDNQSSEWQQSVLRGETFFDPGRSGLFEIYFRDWSSSPKTIWFGRGVSRPKIGQMSAHNLYMQELWKHGIVGYILYAAIILSAINWKKLKQKLKLYLPLLMIMIPYLIVTMIEKCEYDYCCLIVMMSAMGFLEQLNEENNQLTITSDSKIKS